MNWEEMCAIVERASAHAKEFKKLYPIQCPSCHGSGIGQLGGSPCQQCEGTGQV